MATEVDDWFFEGLGSVGIAAAAAGAAVVALLLLVLLFSWQRKRRKIARTANVRGFLERLEAIQSELLSERSPDPVRMVRFESDISSRSIARMKFKENALDLKNNVWRWTVDSKGNLGTTDECTAWDVKVLICLSLDIATRTSRCSARVGSRWTYASSVMSRASSFMNRRSSLGSLGTFASSFMRSGSSLGQLFSPGPTPLTLAEISPHDKQHLETVVSNTLLRLCRNDMLDPEAIRCCIVADAVCGAAGVIRSDTQVLERGRNDHLAVADILPIMCDVADYCILVIEDSYSLSTQPAVSSSASSRNGSVFSYPDAGGVVAPLLSNGCLEDVLFGNAPSDKEFGPAIYLAGLAALSLKPGRQSYVQCGFDGDDDTVLRTMLPYSQQFERSHATLELDSEVAGVELHGGLLCLWALNVSHGSFGFVRDAAPLMAELACLRRSYPWSCPACSRRAVFTASMSDDILQYFQLFRQRRPISAQRQPETSTAPSNSSRLLPERESSMNKRLGTSARAQHMHSLQACLTRRAMISRYLRLSFRNRGADPEGVSIASLCDAGERFTVPSSHPVAFQLRSVTKDVDYMLDKGARGILEEFQRYMTLEQLAALVQGFLVAYVRRINGSGDKNLAHKEQLAAFELYAAAAERQGYLVDFVSDFLCNKAEIRGYQKVTKALSNKVPGMSLDRSNAMHLDADSPCAASSIKYAPLFVNVVGATQLPRIRLSRASIDAADANIDDFTLPSAYCTLGFEGSDAVLLQTGVSARGSNPEWKEGLDLKHYPQGETLVFSVWHEDPESLDRLLGRALLPYSQFAVQEFVGQINLVSSFGRNSQTSLNDQTQYAGALTVRVSMMAARKTTRRITRLGQASINMFAWSSMTSTDSDAGGSPRRNRCSDMSLPSTAESVESTMSIRPRCKTLADQLLTATEVHRKLEHVMVELVTNAKAQAATQGVFGAAQVNQSLHRKPFWELVEANTFRALERRLWDERDKQHGDLAKSARADMADEVDEKLQFTGDPFSLDHFEESLTKAVTQTRVMCDSFWIMHLVMQGLESSRRLVVMSRDGSRKLRQKAPAVVYTVRLRNLGDEDSGPQEVILVHNRIAAFGQDDRSAARQMISEMRTINSICRTLRLGDPDLHPSMWCLSLGQLQDFAEEAERELGVEVYRAASCADIVENSIIGKTKEARTSYARMVNWRNLRQVDVFVSHCWGENFSAFVDSVAGALETRIQAREVNLWICCFALRQGEHEVVKKQVGSDLMDAPFEKALRFAREFLVVRNAEQDMYSRAWCVFEIFRARQLDLKITVTGPDKFTKQSVDIMSCSASDEGDERMIKDAIKDADEEAELNKVVSEIKAMGGRLEASGRHTVMRV